MKKLINIIFILFILFSHTFAQNINTAQSNQLPLIPKLDFITTATNAQDVSVSIQILILLTILALAPSILIMMTAFLRIVIVLSFLRRALGLQTTPPNQVIIGFALFLTFYVMSPVIDDIYNNAYKPYSQEQISFYEFLDRVQKPLKYFMLKQTREKDLALFIKLGKIPKPKGIEDLKMRVIIPAFIVSELTRAFEIGFILYIPFLIIDMVIASILMSMGMMMLPPIMISMPFKIVLFILVDGWHLLVKELILSFK